MDKASKDKKIIHIKIFQMDRGKKILTEKTVNKS